MKLHSTAQTDLLLVFQNHGGHRENTKLRKALENMDLSPFVPREGTATIVMTKTYLEKLRAAGAPADSVIPMKFHNTLTAHLLHMFDIFGGYTTEAKMKEAIKNLDVTVYQQKTTGLHVLVLTDDYVKMLDGSASL